MEKYMIEIDKIYKRFFEGKRLYYVDDSVIFTNKISQETDLKKLISSINDKIQIAFNEYTDKIGNEDIDASFITKHMV